MAALAGPDADRRHRHMARLPSSPGFSGRWWCSTTKRVTSSDTTVSPSDWIKVIIS
jgi:hypothetical protein